MMNIANEIEQTLIKINQKLSAGSDLSEQDLTSLLLVSLIEDEG